MFTAKKKRQADKNEPQRKAQRKLSRTERKQIEAAIARANRTDKKEQSAQDSIPYEDDLQVKSARLVELDTLLNIDGKGHIQPETVIAKSERPSVLDSLKRPLPLPTPDKKTKTHEEVR